MATKRDLEAIETRRIEGARLLKCKVPQAEVAHRLGVSRQSVSRWAQQFAEVNSAIGKFKGKTLGRPRRLDPPNALFTYAPVRFRGATSV